MDIQEDETITCPNCKEVQPDHDGFGFMYCENCKECTHEFISENSVCDLCGELVE